MLGQFKTRKLKNFYFLFYQGCNKLQRLDVEESVLVRGYLLYSNT